jgi:hypothetical protein
LRLGLPHLPVYDLQVHPRDNDLIVATHARGFYVLDDLTPLEHWSAVGGASAYLSAPMPAIRYLDAFYHEHGRGAFVADNKPYGALFTLYLPSAPKPAKPKAKPSVHVVIDDDAGNAIAAFDAQVHAGINRFAWDLSTQLPPRSPTAQDRRESYIFYPMTISGPQALPGAYTARIDVLGQHLQAPVTVVQDPHNPASMQALSEQYDALQRLGVTQAHVEALMARLERVRKTCAASSALLDRLRNAEPSGYRSPAQLSEQIAYLRYVIGQYAGAPTQPQLQLMTRYAQETTQIEQAAARACP